MFGHIKRFPWKAAPLALIVTLLAFSVALAASGDLDGSFDGDGLVTTNVVPSNPGRNDYAYGLAIQLSNGKIVAVGYSGTSTSSYDFAVTRYNVDGSPDTTFNGDGRLTTNFGGQDYAYDGVVQPDGKIIAAGNKCNSDSTNCNVALARYNANGTLDTIFSGDGKVVTDYDGGNNGAYGLTLQPDGKIVVVGYMWNGMDYDFAFYRYNTNGTLDKAFSGDGKAHGNFGTGRQDAATDVVIQSDGKIVAAGYTGDASHTNYNFAIARLTPNGFADTTFSGDGRKTTNFGAEDYGEALALQPDDKIVVVGRKSTPPYIYYIAIARYNTNGNLDTTFNGTGKKVFGFPPGTDSSAEDVIIQSNGKIVVMGSAQHTGGTSEFALARLTPTGALDASFSGDGKVTIDFGGYEFGLALALRPSDGKYVLGGYTISGSQTDFALARVLP